MKKLFTFLVLIIAAPAFAIDPITGPTAVCSGSTITLSDATTGGTWSSSNPAVATIGSSSGVVTGTLSASTPGTATITYTTATETATMDITVNPTPVLSSSLTPFPICDSTHFTYTPTSAVAGTSFAWTRPYIPGIAALSVTGTGPIMEYLDNTTPIPLTVRYFYTLTAGGCSHQDTVTLIVQPKPLLTSHTADTTCSGAAFSYTPMSYSSAVTFAWSRAPMAGISSSTSAGTGNISEPLTNATTSPITVTYVYTLTIGGCSNTQSLRVTVSPVPMLTSPLLDSAWEAACHGIPFNYIPTSPIPGTTFAWSHAAIDINPAKSGTGAISDTLHNFNPGPITVSYVFTLTATGCSNQQTVNVLVGPCADAVEELHKQQVLVYPNPTNGAFSMTIPSATSEDAHLTILNITGVAIYEGLARTNTAATVKLEVVPGIYLLKATTSQETYEQRILVK